MATPSRETGAESPPNLPADIPEEARAFLKRVGYLEPDRLRVGDRVPPLTLAAREGSETVTIGLPGAPLPTVLIFGSYT
jgi:hypothetical protein